MLQVSSSSTQRLALRSAISQSSNWRLTVLISLALHGVVAIALPWPDSDLKTQSAKQPIKVVRLPATSPQPESATLLIKPQLPAEQVTQAAQLKAAQPVAKPPQRQPKRQLPPQKPLTSPSIVQPEQSQVKPSSSSPQRENPNPAVAAPENLPEDPLASLPMADNAVPACGKAVSTCWNVPNTRWNEVLADLEVKLADRGQQLVQLELDDDPAFRVFQIHENGKPKPHQYVHLISIDQGTTYILSAELLTKDQVRAQVQGNQSAQT